MPSRKQRRRRQKSRRHDYEYVYVDEEGREVAVEEIEPEPRDRGNGARAAARRNGVRGATGQPVQKRGSATAARKVPAPSWARVLKRAAIFGPIMFVTIALLDRSAGVASQLLITFQMLVLFVPFSYLVDRMMYRRFLRQTGAAAPGRRPPRGRS